MIARQVEGLIEQDHPQKGDIEIADTGMAFCCPGCGHVSWLQFGITGKDSGHCWQLSGSKEQPTLTPSIHHVGCWHGWLRNGELVSC